MNIFKVQVNVNCTFCFLFSIYLFSCNSDFDDLYQRQCYSDEDCISSICNQGYCSLSTYNLNGINDDYDVEIEEGMAKVEEGEFIRGSDFSFDESPKKKIYLKEYWIDVYEVKVSDYEKCVDDGNCTEPSGECDGSNWGEIKENHPINCVTWFQAYTYCGHIGKRLPTEAEWEKASRGIDGRTYPWGEAYPTCEYAVMNENEGSGCGRHSTWPVGSKPKGKSPYGVHDMSGNVWEWVSDRYSEDAYQNAPERDPEGPESGSLRVVRGGSFSSSYVSWLRAAFRGGDWPGNVYNDLGFRCARFD